MLYRVLDQCLAELFGIDMRLKKVIIDKQYVEVFRQSLSSEPRLWRGFLIFMKVL